MLERAVAAARELGALVVLDVKRGDIGSTAQAYADAYLDPSSPLAVDAITASPFLGVGSLDPLLDTAEKHGGGVFVLALTSNPEGPQVQHARTGDGGTVAGEVLAALAARNAGAEPLGSFGAVVGATIGETDEDLDVGGPLLVPGHRRAGRHGGRRTAHLRRPRPATCCRPAVARSSAPVPTSRPSATLPSAANEAFAALVAR